MLPNLGHYIITVELSANILRIPISTTIAAEIRLNQKPYAPESTPNQYQSQSLHLGTLLNLFQFDMVSIYVYQNLWLITAAQAMARSRPTGEVVASDYMKHQTNRKVLLCDEQPRSYVIK
jgi:hypothetical protein